MNRVLLKLYLLSTLFILCSFPAQAQNFRFIYFQTENKKPFYIKMGEEGSRSAPSGYIIIPRLTEGFYKITIGFPQSALPELSVNITLQEEDAGYLLKKDVDGGWYMVHLVTMKPITTERVLTTVKNRQIKKNSDDFARVLSEVVSDSTINEIEIFKNAGNFPVKREDDNASNTQKVVQPEAIVAYKTTILKLGQKITEEGISVTYIDQADTIDIFIPTYKQQVLNADEQKPKDSMVIINSEMAAVKDVKFIDMELQNPNQQQDSGAIKRDDFIITQKKYALANSQNQEDSIAGLKADKAPVNSKCKKTATHNDFLILRKRMAAAKTEADMQKLAGRQFASVCFTTEHIKNLGVLFIKEEERYKFYVSAYPYVADTENFPILQNQLADSYYINRFNAMLQH